MKTRFLISAIAGVLVFGMPAARATDNRESFGRDIGRAARTVHDSVSDAGRNAAQATQKTHDWFVGELSTAGESASGFAQNIWKEIDLFFYDIRKGYDRNR